MQNTWKYEAARLPKEMSELDLPSVIHSWMSTQPTPIEEVLTDRVMQEIEAIRGETIPEDQIVTLLKKVANYRLCRCEWVWYHSGRSTLALQGTPDGSVTEILVSEYRPRGNLTSTQVTPI